MTLEQMLARTLEVIPEPTPAALTGPVLLRNDIAISYEVARFGRFPGGMLVTVPVVSVDGGTTVI